VLIPFGPKKPKGGAIDIAELSALKALSDLQTQAKVHYEPGFHFVVRLEDSTGRLLEKGEPGLIEDMECYMDSIMRLKDILRYNFISFRREGDIVPFKEFEKEVEFVKGVISVYLDETEGAEGESSEDLAEIGWTGGISADMREFLMSRCKIYLPEQSTRQHQATMSTYLSCALARRRLGASGALAEWNGRHLELSFAPPTPDQPSHSPRIFYRTVPRSQGRLHVPPWRARGILKIKDDKPRFSTMRWPDAQAADLSHGKITISRQSDEVVLQADYLIIDE
jgi:hypothetical protein